MSDHQPLVRKLKIFPWLVRKLGINSLIPRISHCPVFFLIVCSSQYVKMVGRPGVKTTSVPDPKPIPTWIAFSFPHVILEVIYALDEVWGRD